MDETPPGKPAWSRSVADLLRVLLRSSEMLANSFDFNQGLQQLAALMVSEAAADICFIDIVEDGEIVRVAATHRDANLQQIVDELRDRYPPEVGGPHPVARVIETLEPHWLPVMSPEFLSEITRDERHLELVTALQFGSYVAVPIAARNEVMGALIVIRVEGAPPYGEDDVELLTDLARRAAVHLHNARLFEQRDDALWRLRRLQDITDLALLSLPPNDLTEELIHRLRDALDADTVRILLASEDGRYLRGGGAVGLGDPTQWQDELPIGHGFAGRIAATRKPLVITPPTYSSEILSPALRRLEHVAGVPLLIGDDLIGVVHVGHREPHGFDEDDLQLLFLAADRIALAIDQSRRFEQERQKTLMLMGSLLPAELAPIPGCNVQARYLPADTSSTVGGDFYDVFDVRDGAIGILIGDVAGKGIPAAAFVGLARHTVRSAARHTRDVRVPLLWLHEALEDTSGDDYCTALYGRVMPQANGVRFEFASGGHPLPIVLRADGTATTIGTPGTLLGLIPEVRLHETVVDLEPGDLMFLYTDGVTDTRVHPMSNDDVAELLISVADADPGHVCDEFELALRRLRTSQDDDIALLCIAVRGDES
jgi:serine phosphatase RsbU (regulator of sigma subunit)